MQYYTQMKAFLEGIKHTDPQLISSIQEAAELIFEGQEYMAESLFGGVTSDLEENIPKIEKDLNAKEKVTNATRRFVSTLYNTDPEVEGDVEGGTEYQINLIKDVIDEEFNDKDYIAWYYTVKTVMDVNKPKAKAIINVIAKSDIDDIDDIIEFAKKNTVSEAWKS